MTQRIREDVAYGLEEQAADLINEAAHVEEKEREQRDVNSSDLNSALDKQVRGAYLMRAAQLLRADKKGVSL